MSKGQNVQDPFLNALRKERVPVSIFLANGIKLQGQVGSFDQFAVLLKKNVTHDDLQTCHLHRCSCAQHQVAAGFARGPTRV